MRVRVSLARSPTTRSLLPRHQLVPVEPGAPVFDTEPEDLVKSKLNSGAAVTSWLVDSYFAGRVSIEQFNSIMHEAPSDMRRETYCLIPKREQPRHEYLNLPKRKRKQTPQQLYSKGLIDLQTFEDLILPEQKALRDKKAMDFPLPEPFHPCVVCAETKAQIQCMECPNRVCKECVQARFQKDGEAEMDVETFLLLHHVYCLKNGRPLVKRRPEERKWRQSRRLKQASQRTSTNQSQS